jgi:hypothetical protein
MIVDACIKPLYDSLVCSPLQTKIAVGFYWGIFWPHSHLQYLSSPLL